MPRHGLLLTSLLGLAVLAGCQTGERPTFSTDPFVPGTLTGDAAIDTVLEKFDAATTGPATAGYSIVRAYGAAEFSAAVALDGSSRAVTLGNADYLQTPAITRTCTVDGSRPCVSELDPQPASDTTLALDFYSSGTARTLRRDAASRGGPGTLRTTEYAGQTATCVDVPLKSNVTSTYCVLDNGLLAFRNDGAVTVTLTAYSPTVAPATFSPDD